MDKIKGWWAFWGGLGIWVLVVFLVLGAAIASIGLAADETGRKFTSSCQRVGGYPVWNGQFWECIR